MPIEDEFWLDHPIARYLPGDPPRALLGLPEEERERRVRYAVIAWCAGFPLVMAFDLAMSEVVPESDLAPDNEILRMLGESKRVGPLAPPMPWPPPTMSPVAVIHSAADAKGDVVYAGVWLGTSTTLQGLYRVEVQEEGERWISSLRHPPYLDYRLQDDNEYDQSEWPECTEVGTWADWVSWTIHKEPGYLDGWKEIPPEATIEGIFAREFPGYRAGALLELREFVRP